MSKPDEKSGDITPYRELIVNNMEKVVTVLSQMKQWSILSNVVNCMQNDKHPKNVSTMNKENYKRDLKSEEEHSQKLDLNFGNTPKKLQREYLDVYKGYNQKY